MLDADTQAHYRELAARLALHCRTTRCPLIGLNGAQGSGKSTAAAFLAAELASRHGLTAAVLSIDDFYLPRADRQRLATQVHPLFITRGVPGSHDVALGMATLQAVRALGAGHPLALPRYSKADDDRLPETRWPGLEGPVDLILFEGWCVGTPAQDGAALDTPVNALEADEDRDGRWRRRVNAQLAGPYAEWFAGLDALIYLQVPNFDAVHRWRWQQEQDTARSAGKKAAGLQTPEQLARFIQHYQRLSQHALDVLPDRADVVIRLRDDHGVEAVRYRSG
ncbi:kinase [Nevskia sp.]|uniref:kinase n=1 Tax=Nevskia sp. TaxID=1929292 RepID=UPI003F70BA43